MPNEKAEEEDTSNERRPFMQWVAHAPALITALIGIGTYFYTIHHDREAMNHNATLERQTPFLQKQMQFYFEASQAASVLATSYKQHDWNRAYDRFWELYYGNLTIVESPYRDKDKDSDSVKANPNSVESNMVRFGELLAQVDRSSAIDYDVQIAQNMPIARNMAALSVQRRAELQKASLSLAESCRRDIQSSWHFTPPKPLNINTVTQ